MPKRSCDCQNLDIAKAAVINSLSCPDAQRGYSHAIDEFVDGTVPSPNYHSARPWWSDTECTWNRYLAPGTINLRLGAVRRLAYETAVCGLLSADLAAGIRRVKGVKKLGVRLGNWLTPEQGNALWQAPDPQRLRGKRDRALLATLLARGVRRHEIAELTIDHLQKREEHWVIVDLIGKSGHIRTIPVPDWVCRLLNDWTVAAQAGLTFAQFVMMTPFPVIVDFDRWEKSMNGNVALVDGVPITRYWLIPASVRPKMFSPHETMTTEEIRERTQGGDDFYSLREIWNRSKCVPTLCGRLAFLFVSKLYRQMYANTGISTDSARGAESDMGGPLAGGAVPKAIRSEADAGARNAGLAEVFGIDFARVLRHCERIWSAAQAGSRNCVRN